MTLYMHTLTYDVISRKVKFAGAGTNSGQTSTVIKVKFKGTSDEKATYVANICAPRIPMVSGIPSIVNVDENNICNSGKLCSL